MKNTVKFSGFSQAFSMMTAIGVFVAICSIIVIESSQAAHRAAAETGLPAAASEGPPAAGTALASVPGSTTSRIHTTFLPLVIGRSCPRMLLSGRVFNDLNGNGIRDTAFVQGDYASNPGAYIGSVGPIQEPPIAHAVIRAGAAETTTNADGGYALCLSAGGYAVTVQAAPYRFRFPSNNEIQEIGKPIRVTLSRDTSLDIGLGVGPLTIPYRYSEASLFRQGGFVDIDPTFDQVGIYRSYPANCALLPGCGDAHRGIDLRAPEGTVVVAAAPGVVREVTVRPDITMVFLVHTDYEGSDLYNKGFQTSYQHLSGVADGVVPGAFLPRGHPIGYLNQEKHLHFDARWFFPGTTCQGRCYVDLYRDLFHDQFAWKEHDSRYGYSIWVSWGSPGWWTADNLPCFFQP